MWYYVIVVMIVVVVTLLSGCGNDKNQNKGKQVMLVSGDDQPVKGGVTRQEIEKKLAELAKSPAPTKLMPGAMCYKPAMACTRAEYSCTKCGEKTIYTEAMANVIERELPTCRRLVKDIQGIAVALDESQFCKHCNGDEDGEPSLGILVRCAGDKQAHRVARVTSNDLRLIKEFMGGSKVHKDSGDNETPLKNYLPRLQELLGTQEFLGKAEIEKRLAELAKAPAPKKLAPGAMCYEMAAPPERAEYVCVKCGEKTLYTSHMSDMVMHELPMCRRLVADIKEIAVELDESCFCSKCGKHGEAGAQALTLIIRYANDNIQRVEDISSHDIKLLHEFVKGSRVHKGETGEETPLKDYLPRLKQILGSK